MRTETNQNEPMRTPLFVRVIFYILLGWAVLGAIAIVAHCQTTLTYQPQTLPKKTKVEATPWAVIACNGPGQTSPVPAGVVYTLLQRHGIGFRLNAEATDLLHAARERDPRNLVLKYGGYLAAGLSIAMQLDFIRARPQYQKAAGAGAGFLNVMLPMVQRNVPPPASWEALLMRDTDELRPPPGGCAAPVILLGDAGAGFEVRYP